MSSRLTFGAEAEEVAVPATVGIAVTDGAPYTPVSWKTTINVGQDTSEIADHHHLHHYQPITVHCWT